MVQIDNPKSLLVAKLKGVHLFHFDGAPCAQRVRFALAEKGLKRGKEVRWNSYGRNTLASSRNKWTSRKVSLIKKDHLSAEYSEIHPNMVVPALVHDGRLYLESMEIIDYIDETWQHNPLKPEDPDDLADVDDLVDWGKNLHVSVRYVSFNWGLGNLAKLKKDEEKRLAELEQDGSPEQLSAFYESYDRDDIQMETYLEHLNGLEEGYGHIEQLLADGRPFLIGTHLTTADIIWSLKVMRIWECGYPFKRNYPHLYKWYRRISKRPAFKQGVMSHHKGLSRAFRLKAIIENMFGRGISKVVARPATAT